MTQPIMIDLFCKAGGTSEGYRRAGFEMVGVDKEPQPRYPFRFVQADALAFLRWLIRGGQWADLTLATVAAIHASCPCQRYSDLAKRNGNGHEHPDLIGPTRELLIATGKPYVIENVEGAPLRAPMMLCGTMFPGLRVIRHRLFESNVVLMSPVHRNHPLVYTKDRRKAHYGRLDQDVSFVQVTGGGNATVANKRAAMGIDWMTGKEINEAIPPAYTEWVGRQLLGGRK